MSLVMALQDIKPELVNKPGKVKAGGPSSFGTTFFRPTIDKPYGPHASLVRYPAGQPRTSSAHFHEVDQFQVIMEGTGTFGRHQVSPYCIHFSRAYTRYGPLKSDGWAFMVMRSRYDPGSQRDAEKLKQIPNRRPWQVTTPQISFPSASAGASIREVPEIKDDQGLFASTLTMAPHARTTAPDPSGGDGQHVLVVKGSLIHDNREQQAPAVIFTRFDEPPFEILAGAQGLQAIVLNLPKVSSHAVAFKAPSPTAGLKQWQCVLCAFAYDEAVGMPEEGIAPGTRWADVPDTWSCPDCGAGKSDFQMAEV